MTEIVYVPEYQPSSASVRIGGGNGTRARLSEPAPLMLVLALLGVAYMLSKN